jgi:hypothetical protein
VDAFGKWLKQKLAAGDFRLSIHAAMRCNERYLTEHDIMACGKTATRVVFQPSKENWKVVGKDIDNLKLTVICDVRDHLIIVTLY